MKIRFILITLLYLVSVNVSAQFKVVGYLRSRTDMVGDMKKIDLKKITHLNVAFINPDTNGNLKVLPQLDTIVKIAHAGNIKVLLSCGGGSRQKYYGKLLADTNRAKLVKNFANFVDQYNLDGIDVDLEGDDIDGNYEPFVVELRQSIGQSKLLTAALAFYTRKRISDVALLQFDFINMMAYDKTGPWRPADPGQHSPMSYVLDHLNYWKNERGLAREKLIIGVPFYGYGFGELPDNDRAFREMGWKDIVAKFPAAMDLDEIGLPENKGNIYYNGKKTIQLKTELAINEAGGIMIWQLMHDSNDENSLLKVIHNTSKK